MHKFIILCGCVIALAQAGYIGGGVVGPLKGLDGWSDGGVVGSLKGLDAAVIDVAPVPSIVVAPALSPAATVVKGNRDQLDGFRRSSYVVDVGRADGDYPRAGATAVAYATYRGPVAVPGVSTRLDSGVVAGKVAAPVIAKTSWAAPAPVTRIKYDVPKYAVKAIGKEVLYGKLDY